MTFFYRDSWQVQLCEADLRTLCRASRIAPRREAWDDSEIRGGQAAEGRGSFHFASNQLRVR
jgi:hypothetical protein